MAERSSFFNSVNGDRKYKASDFAEYFNSLITNGVFPNPSTNLQVLANNNMTVTLKAGKAWINGYFYINTDDLILPVDVADGVLNRIDRIVLKMDTVGRNITVKVKKGTFASSPVAPILQRDADVYELGIADIYIGKGITSISQANITDLRMNSTYCGIVAGAVNQIDATNLFAQYDAEFNDWFVSIQGSLSGDVSGNLAAQITALAGAGNTTTVKALDTKVNEHLAEITAHAELVNRTITVGSGKNFSTIQAAVDSVKKYIKYGLAITIQVDAGTYAENVLVSGFSGGSINIFGSTATDTTRNVTNFSIYNNTCLVKLKGFNITTTSDVGIIVARCTDVDISNMNAIATNSQRFISSILNSNAYVHDCTVSNQFVALSANTRGKLTLGTNITGTGNTYGLEVVGSSIAQMVGTATIPASTTPITCYDGGFLVKSSGATLGT